MDKVHDVKIFWALVAFIIVIVWLPLGGNIWDALYLAIGHALVAIPVSIVFGRVVLFLFDKIFNLDKKEKRTIWKTLIYSLMIGLSLRMFLYGLN